MTVSAFVGTSVDGFIARPNGDLDFLPPEGGEPVGYNEFMATIDTIVIGRKTFETVLGFGGEWPYGKKSVVVLSGSPVDFSGVRNGIVERMSGSPGDILARLADRGSRNIYVDGGITIRKFLEAGLVHRLIITRVPVLIGEGIPLFGKLPHDIRLRHVATVDTPGGLVRSEYVVTTTA